MKKKLVIVLCAALILAMAGCSSEQETESSTSIAESTNMDIAGSEDDDASGTGHTGSIDETQTAEEPTAEAPAAEGNRVLTLYFSVPEDVDTAGVDAVAGSSVVVKDDETLGNVQYVAQFIHQVVGGDMVRIETVGDYPLTHDALLDYAADEQDNNIYPELRTQIENFDQYDTVLLGYPIWWYDLPMSIYTVLETYDFSGKTVIPFIVHGGSQDSGTIEIITQWEPDADIYEDSLILSRNDVVRSEETVKEWADSLGIKAQENEMEQVETEKVQDTGGDTVLTAIVTPNESQVLYLWEEGKEPANTLSPTSTDRFDPPGFRPIITTIPVEAGVEIKGAVLLCAGGAFQFRGNQWDTYPTAEKLTQLGYQCFVVDYRLRPYTQEEGALDLARAVRFVRNHAVEYGIDPRDIAVVGYSAGGILCGEMVLNWKGNVTPDALVEGYVVDSLDSVSADAAAIGHIYSFYGRLSVGSTDVEKFRNSNLPPTFYAYGTEDPFYRQFLANAEAVREAGVEVDEHIYEGQPHGFGAGNADSDWVPEFDRFLSDIFENN